MRKDLFSVGTKESSFSGRNLLETIQYIGLGGGGQGLSRKFR